MPLLLADRAQARDRNDRRLKQTQEIRGQEDLTFTDHLFRNRYSGVDTKNRESADVIWTIVPKDNLGDDTVSTSALSGTGP
jgi:hypothetical protein